MTADTPRIPMRVGRGFSDATPAPGRSRPGRRSGHWSTSKGRTALVQRVERAGGAAQRWPKQGRILGRFRKGDRSPRCSARRPERSAAPARRSDRCQHTSRSVRFGRSADPEQPSPVGVPAAGCAAARLLLMPALVAFLACGSCSTDRVAAAALAASSNMARPIARSELTLCRAGR
jgi:hypothetical protein